MAFDCQARARPWSLGGLRAHGHAGGMTLLSVDAPNGDFILVRAAKSASQAVELGRPTAMMFAQASLTGRAAQAALAVAGASGPDMARDIAADLDAPQPELRVLAVNALAAVTGRDLRRDAAG